MPSPHARGHHLFIEAAAQLETRHKTSHASHYRIAGPAPSPCLGRPTTGSLYDHVDAGLATRNAAWRFRGGTAPAPVDPRGREVWRPQALDGAARSGKSGSTGFAEQGANVMPRTEEQAVGSVKSLWRYPVKSMAGEELDASEVTGRGLLGDRAYALIDSVDGKVASAKNPRKWPQLFEFGAAYYDNPRSGAALPAVRITLPDGTAVSSEQPDIDAVLSRALGRPVGMRAAGPGQGDVVASTSSNPWTARAEEYWPDMEGLDFRDTVTDFDLPQGTFFDCAVLHVLTTATLDRLGELYPAGQMAVRRFRPNIVIDTADGAAGFGENDWVERTLHLGEQVQLAVSEPCPRCVMITLPQGGLPKDSGILRTAAQHNKTHLGVYASVLRGGQVRHGDHITVQ
jgi:uncharacterized protein